MYNEGESAFSFWEEDHVIFMTTILMAETPEQILYGYGPLGIGIVALSFIGYKMFNIILKDRDKAISDRDTMVNDLFTKVLPAIARNTEVLQARQEIDRDLNSVIKETNKQLDDNAKLFQEVTYIVRNTQGTNRVGGS